MTLFVIIALIILGFVLLAVEFLLLPGITIAGIAALLLFGGGVFSGYYYHGMLVGNYLLGGTVVGFIIFFSFIFKKKTWQRFGLSSEINSRIGELEKDEITVGESGKTVSRLAPIGKAMIDDKLFEVRSNGDYIDAHKIITVIRIEGNKIFVKLK